MHTHEHTCTNIHIQTHTDTYRHTQTCRDKHIHSHAHTGTHTHTDTHRYTQTHTDTHTNSSDGNRIVWSSLESKKEILGTSLENCRAVPRNVNSRDDLQGGYLVIPRISNFNSRDVPRNSIFNSRDVPRRILGMALQFSRDEYQYLDCGVGVGSWMFTFSTAEVTESTGTLALGTLSVFTSRSAL